MIRAIKQWLYWRGLVKKMCASRKTGLRLRKIMVVRRPSYLRQQVFLNRFMVAQEIVAEEPYNKEYMLTCLHEIGHVVVYDMLNEKTDITFSILDHEFYAWQWALMHCPFELDDKHMAYLSRCLGTYFDDPKNGWVRTQLANRVDEQPTGHDTQEICKYLSNQPLIGV